MSVGDAIRIIQIHERARQGRVRARLMLNIRAEEERERMLRERQEVCTGEAGGEGKRASKNWSNSNGVNADRLDPPPPHTHQVTLDDFEAAVRIQCLVRGFLARRRVARFQAEELEAIGMAMAAPLPKKNNPVVKAQQVAEQRRVTQVTSQAALTSSILSSLCT